MEQRKRRLAKSLQDFIDQKTPTQPIKIPETKEMETMRNAMHDLKQLALRSNYLDIPASEFADILAKIDEFPLFLDAAFQAKTEADKIIQLKKAIEVFNELKAKMKMNSLREGIQKQKDILKDLNSENPNLRFITNINKNKFHSKRYKEIAGQEVELGKLKQEVDKKRTELKLERAAKNGFYLDAGLFKVTMKNKPAQAIKKFSLKASEFGWEIPRTLQFMADFSFMMLQLAPFSVGTVGKFVTGDFSGGMADAKVLGEVMGEAIGKVLWDGIKQGYKKETKGIPAKILYKQILADPYFEDAKQHGVKLSESRSLSASEEFFKTDMINNVPVIGAIKDISEDMMVSALNMVRLHLYKTMINANPNADAQERQRIADNVNILTGTVTDRKQMAKGLSKFMSAPKLLAAKMQLATRGLPGINMIGSVNSKGEYDAGSKTWTRATMQMWAGYTAIFGAVGLLKAMGLIETDVCADPRKPCFGRITAENGTSYDITGGMGSLVRAVSTAHYLSVGLREGATEAEKRSFEYKKGILGMDAKGTMVNTLVQNKLHPMISATFKVWSGRDHFGDYFPDNGFYDPKDPYQSRVIAMINSIFPITVVQGWDNMFDGKDDQFQDISRLLVNSLGINAYEPFHDAAVPKAQEWFEDMGEGMPKTNYPDFLTKSKSSLEHIDFYRDDYKKEYRNNIGKILKDNKYDIGYDDMKEAAKAASDEIGEKLAKKYGIDVEKVLE